MIYCNKYAHKDELKALSDELMLLGAKENEVFCDLANCLGEEESRAIAETIKRLYCFNKSLFFHCWRTATYAAKIGMKLNADPKILFVGGLLHDIGKILIPPEILNKPGELTAEEFDIISRHPAMGHYYLSKMGIKNKTVHNMVKFHHKRFDGSGYPEGKVPAEFLPFVHIIGVCDAFDAMTSQRPYSPKKSVAESLLELKRNSGTQFSPEVVECFLKASNLWGGNCFERQI